MLYRIDRWKHRRRLACGPLHSSRTLRPLRQTAYDADLRAMCHSRCAGSVCASPLAGDRTFVPGDGRASGVVFKSALNTIRHVPFEFRGHGRRYRKRGWLRRQHFIHDAGRSAVDKSRIVNFLRRGIGLPAHAHRVPMEGSCAGFARPRGNCHNLNRYFNFDAAPLGRKIARIDRGHES
jgi:hypothetical protein